MSFEVLNEELIILIHEGVLNDSGGLYGICPDKSLEGTLHRIDTHVNYEGVNDIFEIAALYAKVIAQGHVFNDGNKRTAFLAMYIFLGLNGFHLKIEYENAIETMVKIAEKQINQKEISRWIESNTIKIFTKR